MEYDFKHLTNSLGLIYCSIRYNSRLKMVTVTWKGTAPENGIKVVKDEVLELIQKKDCIFLLNDIQDFFSASTEILTDLIRSKWDQEVLNTGVRYILQILKPEMGIPLQSDDESTSIKFFYNKLDAVEFAEQHLEE
jgi:hypothetical protein